MRNLLFLALLMLVGPLFAATVTLDGETLDVESVVITTNSAPDPTPDPDPDPPAPDPDPDPPDPVGPGQCQAASDLRMQPELNLGSPGGRRSFTLTGGDTWVFPMVTTAGNELAGTFNIAEMTGYEAVARRLWVSECPDGDPLPRCSRVGPSVQSIAWMQKDNPPSWACSLKKSSRYYLNIQGDGGIYLSILTNNRP